MIYVLHGDDTISSYGRLDQLLAQNPTHTKINVESNLLDDLVNNISTSDLMGIKKIVIAHNLISKLKLKPKKLTSISESNILILWEDKELNKSQANSFSDIAHVEIFKLPSNIFFFLDSISGPTTNTIRLLNKIDSKENAYLIWQILNRLFLLSLAKMNIDLNSISKLAGKTIQAWQWQKIKDQAKKLDLKRLNKLFNAVLKIDYLTKTGATNIPPKTLISLMFLKYLSI